MHGQQNNNNKLTKDHDVLEIRGNSARFWKTY